MNAQTDTEARPVPVAVQIDGPYADINRDGDEVPVWPVCAIDADGEPVGTVYQCHDHAAARALAFRMARDRRLECVDDSTPE